MYWRTVIVCGLGLYAGLWLASADQRLRFGPCLSFGKLMHARG